jgi:hypothetical protein
MRHLRRWPGVLLAVWAVVLACGGAAWGQEDVRRLHDALTVLYDNPEGKGFDLTVKVRDINYAPRGPAELLIKMYGPDGHVVLRNVAPDDGVAGGMSDSPSAGFDHLALFFGDTRAKGLVPAVRYGAIMEPRRVAKMEAREFKFQVPGGPKGVYRLMLVGQPDLLVSFATSPEMKFGVAGGPDLLYATGRQYEKGFICVPAGATGLDLSLIQVDAPGDRTLKVSDEQGKELALVKGEGGYGAQKVKFEGGMDGKVLKVELSGGGSDALMGAYFATAKGNRYGRPGGRLAAVICPDQATAKTLANGAFLHDGKVFYQHYAVVVYDYLKGLKAEDFVSPNQTGKNPGTYIALGSHEKPAKTCADMEMFDYLANKDKATLNRALKDMLEGMGQMGFDDTVMRGPNLAYEMGCYSYFYPRPAMWMIFSGDLPPRVKDALKEFAGRTGERLAFCRGLELVNGNATASLVAQMRYCAEASGDKDLAGLFDAYILRFTSGGFGSRVGVGPSGPVQEGFGYDQHYGTYPIRGLQAVMADLKDPRIKGIYDRIIEFYSYTYNFETTGGAWSSRTAAKIPARTFEPDGPVPFKGNPGPSFTVNLNNAGEVFAARRPGYYAQTYHGRITPSYLADAGLGQIGYGGGMLGQVHVPGRGPVIVSRLHGDYGADMHWTKWREYAIHSVVGTTMDGLPMIGGDSEPTDAKLTGTVVSASADIRGGSVRVSRTYDFQEDGIACTVELGPALGDRMFGLWSKKSPLRGVVKEGYELIPLLCNKVGQTSKPVAAKAGPDRKATGVVKPATLPLMAFDGDGKAIGEVPESGEEVFAKTVVLDRGGFGVKVELDTARAVHRGFEGALLIRLAEPGTAARDVRLSYRLAPFGAAGSPVGGGAGGVAGKTGSPEAGGEKSKGDLEVGE